MTITVRLKAIWRKIELLDRATKLIGPRSCGSRVWGTPSSYS